MHNLTISGSAVSKAYPSTVFFLLNKKLVVISVGRLEISSNRR